MIDTDKYEKQLRTTMDYMNSFTKGDWNWSQHVQWSHDELFRPLHETASDLLAEVKRLHKVRDYILEKASYPTVKKLHLKDLLNFMEEVIEGDEENE